jgi:hypothetical protein
MAQSQTPIPPAQKTMRKFEQGRYTATDVRWGMTLDLSGADNRSLIAFGYHGRENQQARASRSFLSFRGYCTGEADRCVAVIDPTTGPARARCGAVLQYCKFTYYIITLTSYCSGSSILAVQVSSSAASKAARSSLFGT